MFLQHITTGALHFRTKDGVSWDYLNQPLYGAIALLKWLVNGTGPMAALGTAAAAFIRSDDTKYVGPRDIDICFDCSQSSGFHCSAKRPHQLL